MRVPQVQIADLRAVDAVNSEEVSGRHLETASVAEWHQHLVDRLQFSARPLVECQIVRRQLLDFVADERPRRAAGVGVGRRCMNGRLGQAIPRLGRGHSAA